MSKEYKITKRSVIPRKGKLLSMVIPINLT